MTPDEYCDTIRNIAFDRETTKAAFEAGVHEGLRRALRVGAAKSKNDPDVRELVEALREGRRAIGEHSAPHDCYATGPLTGDEFIDLVQCPACCFIAKHDAVLVKWEGKS